MAAMRGGTTASFLTAISSLVLPMASPMVLIQTRQKLASTHVQRRQHILGKQITTSRLLHEYDMDDDIHPDFDAAAFFKYVRETPEPELLVYNRIPKTGSTTLKMIFSQGAASCPLQLSTLELNSSYWAGFEEREEEVDALVRGQFGNGTAAHGVVSGHFQFPKEPGTLAARWGAPRIEFINSVRKCTSRMRSYMLYSIFNSLLAKGRILNGTQKSYVKLLFNNTDPVKCLQDDVCIDNVLQSEHFSFPASSTNAIEHYIGGAHWKEQGYTSATEAVLERVFAPNAGGFGSYIAIGLLEDQEDSMLLFQCLLPSFFRQDLDILRTWHSMDNDALNTEGLEHPYDKLEARFEEKCRDEDSLYEHIRAIHKLLVTKVKADPSLCRRRPQEFPVCKQSMEEAKSHCVKEWCAARAAAWDQKCTWEPTCQGCHECATECPLWCKQHNQNWSLKVLWKGCENCRSNVEAPVCDWQCYLDRYPDLRNTFGVTDTAAAQHHWTQNGRKENRDCTCPTGDRNNSLQEVQDRQRHLSSNHTSLNQEAFAEAPIHNVRTRPDGGYDSEDQVSAICMDDPLCKGYVLHTNSKFYLLDHGDFNFPGGLAWLERVMVKQSAEGYVRHVGKNCGLKNGESQSAGPPSVGESRTSCAARCDQQADCFGFLLGRSGSNAGTCFLKKNIVISKCASNEEWDMYTKVSFAAPRKMV